MYKIKCFYSRKPGLNFVSCSVFHDDFPTGFHQPLRSGRGSADTDGPCLAKQFLVDFFRTVNLPCVRVDLAAFLEKYLSVGALVAADKEHQGVGSGEFPDVGHAVGHLAADGVEILEAGLRGNVCFDV